MKYYPQYNGGRIFYGWQTFPIGFKVLEHYRISVERIISITKLNISYHFLIACPKFIILEKYCREVRFDFAQHTKSSTQLQAFCHIVKLCEYLCNSKKKKIFLILPSRHVSVSVSVSVFATSSIMA